jgi:WD40 repeat protein
MVLGSAGSAVRIWDLATRQQLRTLPTTDWEMLHSLALSPRGELLAAAGSGWISYWDGDNRTPRPLAFVSPQARSAWQTQEAVVRRLPVIPHFPETVRALAVAPGGKHLATACETRHLQGTEFIGRSWTVQLWHGLSGQALASLPAGIDRWVALAISPDGRVLAFNNGPTIELWEVNKQEIVVTFPASSALVRSLAFSVDSRTLAVGSEDRRITLWDLAGTKQGELTGHTDAVVSLAFSPDGRTLASGSLDGTVKLWNTTLNHYLGTLETTGKVWAVAFSPDGVVLASGGEDPDGLGVVQLWRASQRPEPQPRDDG